MKNVFVVILLLQCALYSQNPDISLLRDINLNRDKNLDNTFIAATNSAEFLSIGVPIVLLGEGLLTKDSLTKRNAVYIGVSVLTATALSTGIKYCVNRPRPNVSYPDIQSLIAEGDPSFPSSHVSDAFALATTVSISYPKWYIIAPAYIWAGAVGYSRMDLGVHYPSDVLAGALLGVGSAFLCSVINHMINHY
jgi:membrane-associated phospholipid phosphatase